MELQSTPDDINPRSKISKKMILKKDQSLCMSLVMVTVRQSKDTVSL